MIKYSPMITQYLEIKQRYDKHIIFYRLGDFYEMFFEDAKIASEVLGLTLTGRDCGAKEKAPMCGVPFHSAEGYIAKLVNMDYKVAVCEQVSDPRESKGIVMRDVVRIITPGTVTESEMLDETKNNYIASIFMNEDGGSIAFCDITEGKIYTTDIERNDTSQKILNEIGKFFPREVILNEKASSNDEIKFYLNHKISCATEFDQDQRYIFEDCDALVKKCFPEVNQAPKNIVLAVGSLLSYIDETQISNLKNITNIDYYHKDQFLELDVNTVRNLEILETMKDKSKKGSLLGILDKTKTPMGSRLVRRFIEKPLKNINEINMRHGLVEEFITNQMVLDDVTEILKNIRDIERLIGKVVYKNANPKDLKILENSIAQLPLLRQSILGFESVLAKKTLNQMSDLKNVYDIIEKAIKNDPPTNVRDGGVFREGFNKEVDDLRSLATGGKNKLFEIEAREREKTGINNLKIGYNKIFGYYIEVTKLNSSKVPDYYIRKQTLVNQERYIIEELKEYEETVLSAEDKLLVLEQKLFQELLEQVSEYVGDVQTTASSVALFDVLTSFARVAITNHYTCPKMSLDDKIIIKDGRHPVVEQLLKDTMFVPNDTFLNENTDRVSIITGPNMAGKSTYMRQVALIVLMAQVGSFVPCRRSELCVVDKIFTRVGASDDLATGQSTFMVEMNEVSYILKNATNKSLIILDEIGRGTSTFDGMSIAKSVVEHILNKRKVGAKTLFSTHYHELSSMESENTGVKNYNIAVKKNGEDIVFLRKIIAGGTDDSYGIEVAKLAGVPNSVILRAREILKELETGSYKIETKKETEIEQLTLVGNAAGEEIVLELEKLDLNIITAIEAFDLLRKYKNMI